MGKQLCVRCQKVKEEDGHKSCAICREKQRLAAQRRRVEAKKLGKCGCGNSLHEGSTYYCKACLIRNRKKFEKCKLKGICTCGKKAINGQTSCEECRQKRNSWTTELRRNRKQQGICIKCGLNDAEHPHTRCHACLEKHKTQGRGKTADNISKGLCIHCSKPAISSRFCETCYLKHIASKNAGGSRNWLVLKEIYDQQKGICPYTGEVLTIGVNADLDHILPQSKGGSSDKKNLQWVLSEVNIMKWNHHEEQFLALIKRIAEYRKL